MPTRRRILSLVAAASAALWATAHGQASKVTRILVGFPPGQATDQVARLCAERLQAVLGQTVIVENKPGQGGSIVLSQLAKSPADGSVLSLSALAAYVVNPVLYRNVAYDSVKDLEPIALVADLPLTLVVHPSVPATTVQELVDHVKANPDKLSHSSSGNGTLSHLLMEELKARSGMRVVHVPYQGSPRAMIDLIAGNVQIGLDTATVTMPHVKTGKLRLLAVGSATRLPEAPEAPTIGEAGYPGFEAVAWIGFTAPGGTPRDVRERLHGEINKALRAPDFVDKLRLIGAVPRPMTLDDFGAFMRREQRRWRDVVERSGLKLDS